MFRDVGRTLDLAQGIVKKNWNRTHVDSAISDPLWDDQLCDRTTGECSCFPGWSSSNGAGGIGDRSDCGYRVPMTTQ